MENLEGRIGASQTTSSLKYMIHINFSFSFNY